MAKLWVTIDPTVKGGNDVAKKAIAKKKKELEELIGERTLAALPSAKFSAKEGDKPKKNPNPGAKEAIRIAPIVELSIECPPRRLSISGHAEVIVQAIKLPNIDDGNLMGKAIAKGKLEDGGTLEKDLLPFTKDWLDQTIVPALKKYVTSGDFAKSLEQQGITP